MLGGRGATVMEQVCHFRDDETGDQDAAPGQVESGEEFGARVVVDVVADGRGDERPGVAPAPRRAGQLISPSPA